MILNLCCIVEGHGEKSAVPILMRRILQSLCADLQLNLPGPIRVSRYKIVKPNELERAVELAARLLAPPRAILILMDADDDPPCILGPDLLRRAKQTRPDVPVGVVLANREFETWFLAAIESLGGRRGIPRDVSPLDDVESIHAKRRLEKIMPVYSPVLDQPALTAQFNMNLARSRSDSFDKCWREIERLLTQAVGAIEEDSAPQ
ncbi:MAG: DUF4276 family protein [Planctomycetes bacterium]|nr:DUF4276 family protein [Planctomycetota bacterium]MCG2685061.1 DUF4276 family protein [Planctomycetales bacterium]